MRRSLTWWSQLAVRPWLRKVALASTILLFTTSSAEAQRRPSGPPQPPSMPPATEPGTAPGGGAAADPGPAPATDEPGEEPEGDQMPPGSGEVSPPEVPPPPPEEAPPPALNLPPTELELARGLPIVEIRVAGNRRISTDDVLAFIREQKGEPFKPEALTRDVRDLWDSSFFDDIEVDLERRDGGVHLRFLVRERPSIRTIEVKGNSEIDTDKLLEGISVKSGATLSYPALRVAVQKLRDMYAEQGYFLAEASFEVIPQRENEVTVAFTIREHEPVTVRRVTFIGNENISDEELREVMFTGQTSLLSFGSGGPFRQDAFERDILMITATYYDRGFLSVQVATPRVMLTPDRTGIEVSITIDEGPQYRIRQLRIFERDAEGREVEPIGGRRHLRQMVRAKGGDIFNRAELAKDLQDVRTMYRDEGFANVEAEPQTELDPDEKLVDIVVPIRRGPPVRFDRIEITGNTKTRDKVIRRELQIAEGELFNETKLETSRRLVTALGYFERVDVSTEQGSAPDRINVNIDVVERPTGTFQIGAGFSSIESFIATAQVQQANLFGNGQSLSLQAQISGLRQLVDIRFFEPYLFDSDFSFSTELFDRLLIYNDFSQSSIGGAVTFGYPLTDPPFLRASLTYTGSLDRVSTTTTSTLLGTSSAVSVFQRLPLHNLFQDGLTSSVRPALTYDTRDNRLFPTSGIFLQGSAELASPIFASDNEFLRYRATGRFYYPLGAGFVAKLNMEGGVVTSPKDEGVPIFARFFLGGILDLRGFRYRTIGPRLPLNQSLDPNSPPIFNGANIGGNVMYYQNLELEFPIVEKVGVRGVFFTDAGNAWNLEQLYCNAAHAGSFAVTSPCFDGLDSLTTLRTSWGFGIRWFSPLGPLRFEWGFPFKPLPYEEASVFEFTIGNFF